MCTRRLTFIAREAIFRFHRSEKFVTNFQQQNHDFKTTVDMTADFGISNCLEIQYLPSQFRQLLRLFFACQLLYELA